MVSRRNASGISRNGCKYNVFCCCIVNFALYKALLMFLFSILQETWEMIAMESPRKYRELHAAKNQGLRSDRFRRSQAFSHQLGKSLGG